MARLSFAIALNLITDGFKQGADKAKGALSSLQAKVITFASALSIADISLQGLVSGMLDIVRETNRATTALQNVSGSAGEYAKNQKFLIDLSKKYGNNVNDMTTAYAKFTAAAKLAGMPLAQQKSLFESVSRATAAFALNSEDTNSVFLALSQMMGKGKIQAQELRLQMGEKLPVALQAMAKAAGVSVGKMDGLMQKGELLSAKVLPNFGKALDELIPQVNTDHLETSVNKLQNAKIELMKSTPVSDTYKAFIDNMTGAVTSLTSALESIPVQNFFTGLKNGVSSVVTYIKNNLSDLVTDVLGLLAGIKISQFFQQWKIFSAESSAAMIANSTKAHTQIRMLESQTTRLKKQIASEEVALASASAEEKTAIEVRLNTKKETLATKELLLEKTKNAAKVADERAAAVQTGNAWQVAWAKIQTGAESLGLRLKALWSTVGPMLLITLITELVARFVEGWHQIENMRKAWGDYQAEAKNATHTTEIAQLGRVLTLIQDRNTKESVIKSTMEQINSQYGTHITNEKELAKWIRNRIKLLENAARADFYARKEVELENAQQEILSRYGGSFTKMRTEQQQEANKVIIGNKNNGTLFDHNASMDSQQYEINRRMLGNAREMLTKYARYTVPDRVYEAPAADDNKKKKKSDPAQTELENSERQYSKSLLEIAAKEKLGMITATEATKARQELVVSTYAQVESSKYSKVKNSAFAKDLGKQYTEVQSDRANMQLKAYEEDYNKKLKDLSAQYDAGAITQEEYGKSLMDLISAARKEVATFNNIPGANKAYTEALMGFVTGLGSRESAVHYDSSKQTGGTKAYERDNTYDYKKEYVDILSEEYDKAQEKLEALKSGSLKLIGSLQEQINSQLANVTSLSDALKIAQLKKDIKDLKKDLQGDILNTVSSIADGSNRVYEAWAQLGETMRNSDASAWEKIYAVWQAISESVNSILSVIDALKEWKKTDEQLRGAEQQLSTQHALSTAQKVAENQIGMASDTLAETATRGKAVSDVQSNTASAASSAAAGAAKMPFPFNLIAIAGAIGAVLALMASIPKFADGGVMSGSAISGDLNLARVNPGEMLLNGTQQKTLFDAINKNNLNGGGGYNTITTKFRGSDLYIVLSNYLKKTGKSL
jgi:tape measure domain-containing protein